MEITYETAVAELTKLADERPDYVHTEDPKVQATEEIRECWGMDLHSYYYRLHDKTPGCIVGALVAKLYPKARLNEGVTSEGALRGAGIVTDFRTAVLLRTAQSHQDDGVPWGEAVRLAVEETKNTPA